MRERAASGPLPGAAKFGRRWAFNLAKLREHVKEREAEACKRAKSLQRHLGASGVATRSGDVCVSLVQNRSAGHLRQTIQKSPERVTLLARMSARSVVMLRITVLPNHVDTLRLCEDCLKIRINSGELFAPLADPM